MNEKQIYLYYNPEGSSFAEGAGYPNVSLISLWGNRYDNPWINKFIKACGTGRYGPRYYLPIDTPLGATLAHLIMLGGSDKVGWSDDSRDHYTMSFTRDELEAIYAEVCSE